MKNFFKAFVKSLFRKRLYTIITLLGICFPLVILTLFITFLSHLTTHNSPQSLFGRVATINHFESHYKNARGDDYTLGMNLPYLVYKNHLQYLKIPLLKTFVHVGTDEICYQSKKKQLKILYSDANFWKITDYNLIEGRYFNKKEVDELKNYAIIDRNAKKFYFGSASSIGHEIKVGDKIYKIIGVVENSDITKSKTYGNVFLPSALQFSKELDYNNNNGLVLALLKAKKDKALLEKEIQSIVKSIDLKNIPDCVGLKIETQDDSFTGIVSENIRNLFNLDIRNTYAVPLGILFFIIFFMILPALNLIYINQSRFMERLEEIGLRKSYGSSVYSIFKQFITENTLITIAGGTVALAISFLIVILFNNAQIIPDCYIKINLNVFIINLSIWLTLGFLSGALPALKYAKAPIIKSLQAGYSPSGIQGFKKIKKASIWLSVEIGFVFIALFCVSNFVVFFGTNLITDKGFNHKGVYEISIWDNRLSWIEQDNKANSVLLEQIKALDYIKDVTSMDGSCPYGSTGRFGEALQTGIKIIKPEELFYVSLSENSFQFFDFQLSKGNWIKPGDTVASICPVMINEKLGHELWGKSNPVGKRFEIKRYKEKGNQLFEVKGVIKSYKHDGEISPEKNYVFFYSNSKYHLTFSGSSNRSCNGYLKFKNDPEKKSEILLKYLHTKYPNHSFQINPLSKFRTEYLNKTIIPFAILMFLCFSILLIVLFGMFGVTWYNINQRVAEIGLRKSVGATNKKIFQLIVGDVFIIASLGLVPAIAIAAQLPFFEIFDFPLRIYYLSILVSLFFISIMLVFFTLMPALKATKIQPAQALHEQ